MVDRLFSELSLAELYDGFSLHSLDCGSYLPLLMSARSVLDVGCGTGELLRLAREAEHAGRLCGLDPAAAMLGHARKRPDIGWVLGDLASVDWCQEFDLVVMTGHARAEPRRVRGRPASSTGAHRTSGPSLLPCDGPGLSAECQIQAASCRPRLTHRRRPPPSPPGAAHRRAGVPPLRASGGAPRLPQVGSEPYRQPASRCATRGLRLAPRSEPYRALGPAWRPYSTTAATGFSDRRAAPRSWRRAAS